MLSVSSELNLTISSDSSLEEGEVPENNNDPQDSKDEPEIVCESDNNDISSETDSITSKNYVRPVDNVTPSTSEPQVSHTEQKAKQSVNFNLAANTVCEYVPDPPVRKDIPVYNPTPIVRPENTPAVGIPRKDILFDLWLIIKKIDQDVGKHLEASMICRGFLRACYTQ